MERDAFHHEAKTQWIGGRMLRVTVEGKIDLEASAPPEFGGPEGFPAPGDLFVASACACYMATFFSVAEGARLQYGGFTCRARGTVERLEEKGFQFTKIDLYPELTIGDDEEEEWVQLPFDMPFDKLTVLSKVEGLTVPSKAEGLRCAAPFVTAAYCKYASFLRICVP
jgi:organic hydroperoxide reductase OsmC/OhrA